MLMDEALLRVPALAETGIRKFYNGPESFTPDNQFLLGRGARARQLLRRRRLQLGRHRLGRRRRAGRWPSGSSRASRRSDLVGVDVRRFAPFHGDNAWLRDRVAEVLGLHYAMPWPNREPVTARDVRQSPAARRGWPRPGAVFGSKMGWERPNVFAPTPGADLDYTWGKPSWLPWSAAEQRATREAVAVFDQTSFSKYVVGGPGALEALQWVCAADVDVPVGHCVYTPFLNARGTYEADLTVTRDGPDEFWSSQLGHHGARPRLAAPRTAGVEWRATSPTRFAVLGVMGPASRDLLAGSRPTTGRRTASRSPPAGRSRWRASPLRATRMTYVGELGWELIVPVARRRGRVRRAVRRGSDSVSATPATTRSSRCAWRRATAPSAAS